MKREWLEPNWMICIGVESELSYKDVNNLLQGLGIKVGSAEDVDRIFAQARPGVGIVPEPELSQALPGQWAFWKVDKNTVGWKAVQLTLALGIRINETHVESRSDGEQYIRVKTRDGKLVKLTFALIAVPTELA